MAQVKITDLVSPETIEEIKKLDEELKNLLVTYTDTARELAKGVDINVKVIGDIDKLEKLLVEKQGEAVETTERLNTVMAEKSRVIANTTNTISRQLMEQERVNKTVREQYTGQEKVKELLDKVHDTYKNQTIRLVELTDELKKNKKAQDANEKAYMAGRKSQADYMQAQVRLTEQHRALSQEKKTLTQIMTAEEKAMQSGEGSYVELSQQLELLKKAYKNFSDEAKETELGKEMEEAIQNLDAHLKDAAADMGEFQRNVGNYAIVGYNGVVATESLIAVLNQEAKTQQDLVDQTKILEEAKRMLNKDDADYGETLAALNAKLEENKRKLLDVSDILGKEATSVAEAEAQNKRLSEAIKHVDLTSADAKERLEEMREQIERNNRTIAEATGANEKYVDTLLSFVGLNFNLGSSFEELGNGGNFIEGLNTKVKAFGKTLMGLLANPWVLALLGITGVVSGFKWWYDYNKGLIEASRLTENFTGATGEAADKITADMEALADDLGAGYDQTIGAANTLVQQLGLSWGETNELMEKAIAAGADMSGNFLSNIERFAPALRDAGVSADEFMAILAETRNGVFNEDAINNILKGGTRLRAMTKQISASLDAVGISSKQMQKDLEEGNITMLEAVQQVAQKLKELPENSQEAGMVMKNVFGRTAAEGGTLLLQSIADINTNLDKSLESMGELGRVNLEHMKAQKEVNEVLASVFKATGTSFETMTTKAKTFVTQGLVTIIKKCVDIVNWFVRMYNGSMAVRGAVNYVVNSFKYLWEVARFVMNEVIDSFKAAGTVLEGIFTMNWDLVKQGWQAGLKSLEGNVETLVRNMASNAAEAYNKTLKDNLQEIKVGFDDTDVKAPNGDSTDKNKPTPIEEVDDKEAAKRAKEAEKRAKEELKRLNELEESKIALMEDSHEKELALIRLKFKKKIDEIRGNGQTETALRIQLALECEKEVADCELKYQRELSKINLANRLAAVEKGSRKELILKLAQLEANRQNEIEGARKTGADVNLINEKFDKERLKMQEEYALKRTEKIQKEYAAQSEERETQNILALAALENQYTIELALAGKSQKKREQAEKKFQEEMRRIQFEYAKQTSESTIEMYQKMLEEEELALEDRIEIERELARAKAELEKLIADFNNDTAKNKGGDNKPGWVSEVQKWADVAKEALNSINDIAQAVFDRQIQRIEEMQEALQASSDAEQERISDLAEKKVISEEEAEARKRAAEAKTAIENEKLEKQKQALKMKQAKWDKANNLVQAVISTALAVTQALPNVVMAAVVGALGAAQVATILAQPIPKYAKGTDYHAGGPAIVGDGGRKEVVLFNGNAWLTPDTPTLVDMPKGASVIPGTDGLDKDLFPLRALNSPQQAPVIVNNDYKRLENKMDSFINLLKRQTAVQHMDSARQLYASFKNTKL